MSGKVIVGVADRDKAADGRIKVRESQGGAGEQRQAPAPQCSTDSTQGGLVHTGTGEYRLTGWRMSQAQALEPLRPTSVEVASDPNPVELRHTLLLNVNQNLILMPLIPSDAV